jgi:uncharacterized protein (DUF1778 family)
MTDRDAVERERISADRRWFVLPAESFAAFEALVDQPARDLPRLRALLTREPPAA